MLRHNFNGVLKYHHTWQGTASVNEVIFYQSVTKWFVIMQAKFWLIVLTVINIHKGTTKIKNNMSANGDGWSNVLNIISKHISPQTGFELTILKL